MSNDPTKIYDDKLYTFPEDKTKENINSSANRWTSRWDNRWKSRWGNQFTENQEEIKSEELNKPLPKMSYKEFIKMFEEDIERIRISIIANGNYHKAVLEMVRRRYGVKYEGGVAKSSEEALMNIYKKDVENKNQGKGKEYMDIADDIAEELNTVGSDWHTNLIIPYRDSLIKKQEQYNKELREEVAQQRKEKRIEKVQNKFTYENYSKESPINIIQNAEILSYEAFVSKHKDAIEGRAKSLEKKNQYSGVTAELVATMQIAQLVYGVQLKEIRSQDNSKVQGYKYGKHTRLTEEIKKKHPHSEASQKMRSSGEVMQFFFNTGYCIDPQYEKILDTTWWEKAKQFKDLRESKIDALRATGRQERVREQYEKGLNELMRKKQLKELNKLRNSKTREAMNDLGLCLFGIGLTIATGGFGALAAEPLVVLLLEADEIIGASRVLLTPANELDPNKEYKIIKGQFIEWRGTAGDTVYENIAFFMDGKSIIQSFLQRNPEKSTIRGITLVNLLEQVQHKKDKIEFIADVKDKVAGEDKEEK